MKATLCSNFADIFDRFRGKNWYSVLMPRKAHDRRRLLGNLHLSREKTDVCDRSGMTSTGERHTPSFATLSEAEAFQKQKRAELERHREGRFNLDDREMLSQARDLASSHGYTVLQAVQEWHSSKGSSKAMPLGEVIEKFLARQIEPICRIHGQAKRRYAAISVTFWR